MNPGDLVSVLYESTRYHIVMEQQPRDDRGFAERMYKLLDLQDGTIKHDVRYSTIKVVSSAESR